MRFAAITNSTNTSEIIKLSTRHLRVIGENLLHCVQNSPITSLFCVNSNIAQSLHQPRNPGGVIGVGDIISIVNRRKESTS
jgi:hypothetical protein